MLQIHSDLKELFASLCDSQHPATDASYKTAYLHFRGLVDDAKEHNVVYRQWAQQYLVDVSDESGEVVKLHESPEEMKVDIEAFIKLIERTEEKK